MRTLRALTSAIVVATFAACHRHWPNAWPGMSGAMGNAPAMGSLVVDAGRSDVTLRIGQPRKMLVSNAGVHDTRDSVSYIFETTPANCAEVDVRRGRLGIKHRRKECKTRWAIVIPRLLDVRVITSNGNVEIVTPSSYSVRLRSGNGTVTMFLDDVEVKHVDEGGDGDAMQLGDMKTLPRLDVRTGTGSVRAELLTYR